MRKYPASLFFCRIHATLVRLGGNASNHRLRKYPFLLVCRKFRKSLSLRHAPRWNRTNNPVIKSL